MEYLIFIKSTPQSYFTLFKWGKKRDKGIFALDGTRLYVYIQLNSVVKAHKKNPTKQTKLQTKKP